MCIHMKCIQLSSHFVLCVLLLAIFVNETLKTVSARSACQLAVANTNFISVETLSEEPEASKHSNFEYIIELTF